MNLFYFSFQYALLNWCPLWVSSCRSSARCAPLPWPWYSHRWLSYWLNATTIKDPVLGYSPKILPYSYWPWWASRLAPTRVYRKSSHILMKWNNIYRELWERVTRIGLISLNYTRIHAYIHIYVCVCVCLVVATISLWIY